MHLSLYNQTRIKEVKKQFSALFPFLKLEFFRYKHSRKQGSALDEKISEGTILQEVSPKLKEGVFSFDALVTVADFEQRLQQEHGLPVQVFRKSGNIWLETVQTDNLKLHEQNAMGEETIRTTRFNINTLFL